MLESSLACYTASLNTVTLLEYLDLDALLEYHELLIGMKLLCSKN